MRVNEEGAGRRVAEGVGRKRSVEDAEVVTTRLRILPLDVFLNSSYEMRIS